MNKTSFDPKDIEALLEIIKEQHYSAINLKVKEVKFEIDFNGEKAELILKIT